MKQFVALILLSLALSVSARSQELEDNEILRIDDTLKFDTRKEGLAWRFSKMSFKEWSQSVHDEQFTELIHQEKTDEFYYSILRYKDFLIFCVNDLAEKDRNTSTGVEASDPGIAWRVREKGGSKIMGHDIRSEYPGGALGHRQIFSATKIVSDFEGELALSHKEKSGEGKEKDVKSFKVVWKKVSAE